MMGVYCFSGSGHSRAVASYLASVLKVPLREIENGTEDQGEQTAVVVFPVYSQNIPKVVKGFLRRLTADNVALVATYGRISHGNVVWEAARLVRSQVIAGAYVPTGHTFLLGEAEFDKEALAPLISRIRHPQRATIRREKKHIFANFFPNLRARVGVSIRRGEICDGCHQCSCRCPVRAMKDGVPTRRCIRCLRCVYECPKKALTFQLRPVLRRYLRREKNVTKICL